MRESFDIKQLCIIPPPYGGVSVFVYRLIQQLVKDGYSVGGYYSSDNDDDAILASPMFDEWKWMETSKFFPKVIKYIRETRKYKLVHSHFSLEGMLYLWTLKTFCHKKIIISIHNSMVTEYYLRSNPINRFFLRKMLKSDVTWVAVSEQGKSQLLQLPFIPTTEIHVIPAYIPDSREVSPLSNEMQSYIDTHSQIIAFYGHSFMNYMDTDIYGFSIAIESFSILREKHPSLGLIICLAEDKDTERICALHELAKNYGVDNIIYWQIGAIDNIKELWKQSHIYFRPTATDGDSVAVREAIDEGAVVVASNVAPRPPGVISFCYGDIIDAVVKLEDALAMERHPIKKNMQYYYQMKSLYDIMLNKDIRSI